MLSRIIAFKMSEELTNLNWLSFAPIEINASQVITVKCVTKSNKKFSLMESGDQSCRTALQKVKSKPHDVDHRKLARKVQRTFHKRPQCSYSCLITMALKASETGCLPVHLIYKYIEQEFPYFKTAPEGWKNSIRHNLSMNQNFIKVSRDEIPSSKKGFLWAINPARMEPLNQEIDKTLKTMGRKLVENGEDCFQEVSYHLQHLFQPLNDSDSACTYLERDSSGIDTVSSHGGSFGPYQLAPFQNTFPDYYSIIEEPCEYSDSQFNLQLLNSIVGLETRNKRSNTAKVEWSPSNCLDQQPSTEAIRSLFGVSLSTTSSTEELIMQSNQEKSISWLNTSRTVDHYGSEYGHHLNSHGFIHHLEDERIKRSFSFTTRRKMESKSDSNLYNGSAKNIEY